jgi:hypothetical protein
MFIILNWSDDTFIGVVSADDGTPLIFQTHADAEDFAESQLHYNWKIINLEG